MLWVTGSWAISAAPARTYGLPSGGYITSMLLRAKLPVKARQAAAPFKNKLDSLQKELSYAEMAMEKWMRELKRDSVIDNMNMEERIKYLNSEKLKVSKVKENILKGIQKADSVLNNKF